MFELQGKELKIVEVSNSFSLYPNHPTISVYVRGCFNRPCQKDCCNTEIQKYEGFAFTKESVMEKLKTSLFYYDTLTILGGEPLCQDLCSLLDFVWEAKSMYRRVGIYTSFEFEEIPNNLKNLVDLFKCGWYDTSKLNENHTMRLASTNQKFYLKDKNGNWKTKEF